MEPRKPDPKTHRQDRPKPEKGPTPFKPRLERLEERVAPSGLGNGFGHHPWGKGW
jgi:hypothetical protein